MALALSREVGEEILIGDDIVIKVVSIKSSNKVRLSFEAPSHIKIHRREVYDAIKKQERESSEKKKQQAEGGGVQENNNRETN